MKSIVLRGRCSKSHYDGTKIMADKKITFVCNNCGQAFTTFLRDMAEHNEKVVCPRCGTKQDVEDTTNPKGSLDTTKDTTR